MVNDLGTAVISPGSRPRARPDESLKLQPEMIDSYFESLRRKGRTQATLQTYRRDLDMLYSYLPEDKRIRRGTLEHWRDDLLEGGYAARTVNVCLSAANGLLEYCGRREFQLQEPLKCGNDVQPELTRAEYLRLLSTARLLGKERVYLLVKVFGTTGLTLQELPRLTVQMVESGRLVLSANQLRSIPACLRNELLDYARRNGIQSGPLFVTREGKPIGRSNITAAIQALCAEAQVEREKGTPRCLRKLYQTTQAGIRANMALLLEQAHDRILETEQLMIGWREPDREVSGF